MDWSTLPLKELLLLPMLTKKLLHCHDIREIVPDYSALHLHNVCAITMPFITKRKGLHKNWSFLHSYFCWTNLWYYCIVVRQVGFQSLQSDMTRLPLSRSLFSECWSSSTLYTCFSSLFLVLQTVLDQGALKTYL